MALSHMTRKARPLTSDRAFYLVAHRGSNPGQAEYECATLVVYVMERDSFLFYLFLSVAIENQDVSEMLLSLVALEEAHM